MKDELDFVILKGKKDEKEMLDKYWLSIKTVLNEVRSSEYTRDLFLTGEKLVYVLMEVTFNYEDKEPTHDYECLAFNVAEDEVEYFAFSARLERRIEMVARTNNYEGLVENMRNHGENVESVETRLDYVIEIPTIEPSLYEEDPTCMFSSDASSEEVF